MKIISKHHPILFNTEMVQAILEGRKTQTRRLEGLDKFNENPNWFRYDGVSNLEGQPQFYDHYFETIDVNGEPTEKYTPIKAKVKPGDILWVRETFSIANEVYIYKVNDFALAEPVKWNSAIHMPKKAARIFLEITDISIERLNDITEEDAIAEGVVNLGVYGFAHNIQYQNYLNKKNCIYNHSQTAISSFQSLWQSINGTYSWDANPYVWVVKFKQVEKPKNFLS